MELMTNDLKRGFELYQQEYEDKALEVLRSGWYVLGRETETFEKEWAACHGVSCCVGLASGLDALCLSFRVLGIGKGDEVIVPGNTYIASVMGVTSNGAVPVFVEPDQYYSIDAEKIEQKITRRTKAVLVVHLYGIPADMDRIVALCEKYGLKLVEDCAQSHGAMYKGRKTGTFGDIGCYSFYPSKNLGAFGDGGAVVTDHKELADQIRILRNYGSKRRYYHTEAGVNSRLDEIQAGLLRVKLKHLEENIRDRERIADRYAKEINNPKILLPEARNEAGSRTVWHQYVVRCGDRENFRNHLKKRAVGTLIHYPVPPHLEEVYRYLNYKRGDLPVTEQYADTVCSIPVYHGMTDEEQDRVIKAVNEF